LPVCGKDLFFQLLRIVSRSDRNQAISAYPGCVRGSSPYRGRVDWNLGSRFRVKKVEIRFEVVALEFEWLFRVPQHTNQSGTLDKSGHSLLPFRPPAIPKGPLIQRFTRANA
jgi:hypothetical protein